MAAIFEQRPLDGRAGVHVVATEAGEALSFAAVLERWRDDPEFTDGFCRVIADCAYAAVFFETPAMTADGLGRAFEFVLLDAPSLARVRADARAFARHLRDADEVASFANLGGDAVLVAPCDRGADCAHLASFTRSAGVGQQRALWRAVAEAYAEALGSGTRRWLSTSGLGVYWLHVRVDVRPKYYSYAPYR